MMLRSQGLFLVASALLLFSCSQSGTEPAGDVALEESLSDGVSEDSAMQDVQLEDTIDPDKDVPFDIENLQEVDVATDPTVYLDEGRYWLENGEAVFAFKAYEKALALAPDNPEARFGAALSRFVTTVEFFGMLTSLPSQLAGYASGDGTKGDEKEAGSENEFIVQQLHDILSDLHGMVQQTDLLLRQVDEDGFQWVTSGVPIFFNTRPFVLMEGRFDRGDLYLLRSATSFFLWLSDFLLAQDFNSDLVTVVSLAMADKNDLDLEAILMLVRMLIDSNAEFLGLQDINGRELFDEGSTAIRNCGEDLWAALQYLESEDLSGPEDVTSYDNDQGTLVLVFRNLYNPETGESLEMRAEFSPTILSRIETLVNAMSTPGAILPFSQSLGLQIAAVLNWMNQFGILGQFAINLPVDVSGLQLEALHGVLSMFLADSFGFDYVALAEHPHGLGSLLPLLGHNTEPFPVEWECPTDTTETGWPTGTGGIVCGKEVELLDAPHFVSTEWEMPTDGIASPLPYLLFSDPTLGGWIFVNVNADDPHADPEWVQPDQALVNLGLRWFLAPVQGLLR